MEITGDAFWVESKIEEAWTLPAALWGLGETGATGPSGNRYGDPAGHTCLAIAGPVERAVTLQTGSAERQANMDAFAKRALELLLDVLR